MALFSACLDVSTAAPVAHVTPARRLVSRCAALLLLLAWAPAAHAASVQASVATHEGWRYRWGDAPASKDGLPSWATETGLGEGWKPTEALRVPPGRDTNTFLWLSVPIPQGEWIDPALFLGVATNAVELYFEGQRIYSSGKIDPTGVETPENTAWHLVPLPPSALGKRVLLRFQSNAPAIGVAQDARVGARHELLVAATRKGLAPFVLGVLLIAVSLAAVGAAVVRRQRRMLVPLTIFTLGSGLLMIATSALALALWNTAILSTVLTLLGSYLVVPGLSWFILDSIIEGRHRWFRWCVVGVSVPASLQFIVLVVDYGLAQHLMQPLVIIPMAGLLVCIGVAAVESLRGNPDARIFVTGLVVFFLFALVSVLPMFGLMDSVENMSHWGFLALALSLVGIVVRRSAVVVRALARHTRQLEERQQEVKRLAESLGSGAGELATVGQQLRAATDDQTAGISRQAAALREAEQTVEEIRRGSQLAAEKAQQLASSAMRAETVGREGATAIRSTLANLEAIRAEVSDMAQRILALDARTREIAGIVDTVKTLADQSNMLAINAAIEAARSGEHGKGFGVVSREVRSLADQSIRATQRIRDVLDSVGQSMRDAAKMSEQGEERVKVSLDAVRASGEQLQQLAGIIDESSTGVRQITAAVAQQDAGTSQIAQAIQELSSQMQRTLVVVQQTQSVSRSVHTLAEGMGDIAQRALKSEAWLERAPGMPAPAPEGR